MWPIMLDMKASSLRWSIAIAPSSPGGTRNGPARLPPTPHLWDNAFTQLVHLPSRERIAQERADHLPSPRLPLQQCLNRERRGDVQKISENGGHRDRAAY